MEKLYQDIINGIHVRQNLSSLRQAVKDTSSRNRLEQIAEKDPSVLITLLSNEDAKTRKNAVLLMGDLGLSDFLAPLFHAYQKEGTLFVRSSYLTALRSYDCSVYMDQLKARLEQLVTTPLTPENKKHVQTEMRELNALIISAEGTVKHTFTGFREQFHCVLLTNRLHKNVTADQIEHGTTNDSEELLYIRTYSELLLVIPDVLTCPTDPAECAAQLANSQLLPLLKKTHSGSTPFYFRIGIKSPMPLDKKSVFAKKMSAELERLTGRELLNSTSNYELEIRLIENKMHTFNVMIKLYSLPDERFSYRKEAVAASMKPVNAALLVELAKDYMAADAQILDPFCGVATLLIERQMVVKGNTSYGIDTFPEAIDKAKINTEAAGQIIHFVNKSFFEFTHEYLFDEIFTDMPFETGHKSDDEIYEIYKAFFRKARDLLTEDGTIIMYSRNPEYVRSLSKLQNYKIIKEWEILDKENAWLFILR